jgi:hypothetical protein
LNEGCRGGVVVRLAFDDYMVRVLLTRSSLRELILDECLR